MLADFNGDSFLDAATPNSGASSVSVALGDGAGGFATPSSFTVDAPPQAITSGYLNDDAVLDLATANDRTGNNDTVSVLIGSGTGTFTNTTNFGVLPNNANVDAQPRAIVVGEWTEDEHADIAVTAYNTSQIAAFGNNSNNPGTFAAPVTINNLGNPWGLVSGQFDTQKEDVLYLGNPNKAADEGRNVGYGIVIVEYPVGTGQYFAFLTNHNQDNPRTTQDACGQFVGDDFQKYVGNTVTVVRINPAQFAPTNERTANDEVVATLQVGCGPHGIDATSDGAYVLVANEYDGTVSRIDVAAALSPLPNDPFTPTMQGVTATINIKPSGYPPTAGSVLTVSRGIDVVEGIPGAGANGATGTRAFATIAYPWVGNPSQKGRIAVIRDLTSGNPSVEGWLTGDGQQFLGAPPNPRISLGGQPLGVTALLRDGSPSPVVVPRFDEPARRWDNLGIRLVVASGQWRDGASAFADIPTFSMVDVNFLNGNLTSHWVWPEFPLSQDCPITPGALVNKPSDPSSPECRGFGIPTDTLSGSIASSSDGLRAYIARYYDQGVAGPKQAGAMVIDANPAPLARLTGNRLLGAFGRPEGVFSIARIPLSSGASDPKGKKHKLYQGNRDTTFADPVTDYRGIWESPEPLVIPKNSHVLQSGTFNPNTPSWVFSSEHQILVRDTTVRTPKIRTTEPALAFWRADFDAATNSFSPLNARVALANSDGSGQQYLACTSQSHCSCAPWNDCTPQPNGLNAALLPSWAVEGAWLLYVRLTDHGGTPYPDIIARRMADGFEWNLTKNDNRAHADPVGRVLTGSAITVVFTRDIDDDPVSCTGSETGEAKVQGLAMVQFETSAPAEGLPITLLTTPQTDPALDCAAWDPDHGNLGDFDPDISPQPTRIDEEPPANTTWVLYSRRFDQHDVTAEGDKFGDFDLMAQTLDGGLLKNLTDADDGNPAAGCGQLFSICADQIPSWNSDASRIAFALVSAEFSNNSDIYTMGKSAFGATASGRTNAQLNIAEVGALYLDSSPSWYPGAVKTDQNPDLVFLRTLIDLEIAPPDLFRLYHPRL